MTAFAIRPAVLLRDGYSVTSSSEAADIVRQHATAHCSLIAAALLRRLERLDSSEDAQGRALEFRAWAAREGLLLQRPIDGPAIGARPLPPR
jgi:hypothetical protein